MTDFSIEKSIDGPVIGLDEVGRGPLAGPVVSCGCCFSNYDDLESEIPITDSKKHTAKQREKLFIFFKKLQKEKKLQYYIGYASVEEIDQINILEATKLSMKRVVEKFWNLNLIKKPQDIFKLNYKNIEQLDGWGELSANNLKSSIEKSKKVSLQRLIYSIGIRHIGIENAKLISDNVKNISNLIEVIKQNNFDKFLSIDGIGETQVNSLKSFFSNQSNFIHN